MDIFRVTFFRGFGFTQSSKETKDVYIVVDSQVNDGVFKVRELTKQSKKMIPI